MSQPLVEDDPRRLGPYDIVGRLGEGGQGVVYLGRTASGGQVAVKLLHHGLLTDSDARAMFLREAEIARRVARFSTAPVLHADLAGQRPYIVSEYVPGPSLRDLVRVEGPRRGAALDRLAISTATALAAIHRAGVLHRDFKPANILMGPEGPVVIDFGIARALDAPGTASSGPLMGTPSYLAPEQLGGAPVTEAADIFAWGVTMVFAASGRPAFGMDSTPAVINRILNQKPVISGLDGLLLELVTASLSKDPAKRPSADDLVARLTSLPARRPARGRRRTMIMAIAGSTAAALLVTGGVLLNTRDRPAGSSPEGHSTSRPPVPTTAPATAPASLSPQTRQAERGTSAPAPRPSSHARTPAATTRPARSQSPVSPPTAQEHRRTTSAPDPEPSPTKEPAAPPTTTAPPGWPPADWPTGPFNTWTCIPSVC
ncbi:serine/threonine protein kinase [Nonomuraea muscovyensis]|uniref:non-specific serine/threonine protein kinase n=1 Tax=Nonomuraea muscovyensis TaxID=1124761 RepID=A0A7X0C826_9ACTN|nr:serine/threonine-protein kinase [Nonomuraea muscovyensis]MBB6349838.1 serine/threonine protein kinase [Nonomuraea muscovyensis]